MERKVKKLFVSLAIFLTIIIAMIGVFFWTYYTFTNKQYASYEKTINSYIEKINKQNNSTISLNTNQNIDSEKIKNDLPILTKELLDTKKELKSDTPPKKLKTDYDYLYEGLDNNINIYKQITSIVSRPDSTDIEKSLNELKEYRNNCMNYYALFSGNNHRISLPDYTLKLIENTITFGNNAIMDRKAKEIIKEQNIEFANDIENISKRFTSLFKNRNNMELVLKARKENSNYDDIISLIEEDKKLLKDIQIDFSKITIPSAGIEISQTFESLLQNYDIYLQNFKHALINEKSQALTGNIDENILNLLYSAPNDKYTEVELTFNIFAKSFAKFKTSEIQE